jgi:hypothetical protein
MWSSGAGRTTSAQRTTSSTFDNTPSGKFSAPPDEGMSRPNDLPSQELEDLLTKLNHEVFGTAPGELSTLAQAEALLVRIRQEVGLPTANGDGSHEGLLRATRETAREVGV